MPEKTFLTPEVLPVLPVRDTVLFPGARLPLTVGRESSLALVGSLQGEEKLLGVVAQLDPRIEDPAAADLHKVGTLARVHKTVKMPNGNVVVFLEGLQRVQIVELVNLRPYLKAQVKPEPDIIGEVDTELEALQRNAQDLFREVVSHSPQLSDDLQSKAMSIEDPGELADFIAGMLPSLSTLLRQELIETASVRKRLEILIRELSKELEVLELRSKILRCCGNRHCQGARYSGRRPLRFTKGEGTHPRLPGGEETATGDERAHPVLCRPSGRGQNLARQVHRAFAGTQVRAHLARRNAR